jgi:hypothetical protein
MFITYNSHIGKSTYSKAIQFQTGGEFTHTSINLNGVIYEAVIKKGVIKTEEKNWDSSTVCSSTTFNIDVHTHRALKYWLDAQVGKGYDYLGILSFIWKFIKQKKGKWWCSELGTETLAKQFSLYYYKHKQDPTEFYYMVQTIYKITTDR